MNAKAENIAGGSAAQSLLLNYRDARFVLGGISENTFKLLMETHGVQPVRIRRRVLWHREDLRHVASKLRERSRTDD